MSGQRVLLDRDELEDRLGALMRLVAGLVPEQFAQVVEAYGDLLAWISKQPSTDL